MRNVSGNHWIPDDGYKYVTNGTVFSESIRIGTADSISNWHDTNDDPPEPEEEVSDLEALEILLGGAT